MRVSLAQTVFVENVAGAGGSIGAGRVARAAPDGYTLVIGYWGTHVANGALYALPYDVVNDFEPIALTVRCAGRTTSTVSGRRTWVWGWNNHSDRNGHMASCRR
jgi:hypothetical protein